MKRTILILILILISVGILMPVIDTQAAMHIFNKQDFSSECRNNGDCNFCDMMRVFYNIGEFIFSIMIGIAMILFLWGSIGLIINWGNAEMIAANKKLMVNTIIGVVIILLAWILVDALLFLALDVDKNVFIEKGMWYKGPKC